MPTRERTFRIYPPVDAQMGGPRTFATHLANYLESNGYKYYDGDFEDLEYLIVFVQAPFGLIRRARRAGTKVVLRLDGLYYPRKHGWLHKEYLRTNLRVWFIRRYLCDYIVYQSEFCRKMAEGLLGTTHVPFTIIHNGIPDRKGSPPAAIPDPPESQVSGPLRLVATGRFRGMDMLPATIRALDLCTGEFEFTLDVYGPVDVASEAYLKRSYVRHHGKVSNEKVRGELVGYHALVFTQFCAPCPNTVIEAVAVGLPVISYDTGAIKELLTFNQVLIARTPARLLHGRSDFAVDALAACIRAFQAGKKGFKAEAERHRRDFSQDKTLALYLKVLESLRRFPEW